MSKSQKEILESYIKKNKSKIRVRHGKPYIEIKGRHYVVDYVKKTKPRQMTKTEEVQNFLNSAALLGAKYVHNEKIKKVKDEREKTVTKVIESVKDNLGNLGTDIKTNLAILNTSIDQLSLVPKGMALLDNKTLVDVDAFKKQIEIEIQNQIDKAKQQTKDMVQAQSAEELEELQKQTDLKIQKEKEMQAILKQQSEIQAREDMAKIKLANFRANESKLFKMFAISNITAKEVLLKSAGLSERDLPISYTVKSIPTD
jgi:hypothetical protein